jgi:hypothetical protein
MIKNKLNIIYGMAAKVRRLAAVVQLTAFIESF